MTSFHDSFNRDENEVCSRKKKKKRKVDFLYIYVGLRSFSQLILFFYRLFFNLWNGNNDLTGVISYFYERLDVKEFYMNDAFLSNSREAKWCSVRFDRFQLTYFVCFVVSAISIGLFHELSYHLYFEYL